MKNGAGETAPALYPDRSTRSRFENHQGRRAGQAPASAESNRASAVAIGGRCDDPPRSEPAASERCRVKFTLFRSWCSRPRRQTVGRAPVALSKSERPTAMDRAERMSRRRRLAPNTASLATSTRRKPAFGIRRRLIAVHHGARIRAARFARSRPWSIQFRSGHCHLNSVSFKTNAWQCQCLPSEPPDLDARWRPTEFGRA